MTSPNNRCNEKVRCYNQRHTTYKKYAAPDPPDMHKPADLVLSIVTSFTKSLLILILVSVLFRVYVFSLKEPARHDEKLYSYFMDTLSKDGVKGLRLLVGLFPDAKSLSSGPLPFRVLFISIGALICKASGNCGLENLTLISFFAGLGVIIAGFLLFRYWFTPGKAFLASLLLVTSPLGIALANRALPDTLFTLTVILAALFFHRYWLFRKKADSILFGIFVFLGVLTKESMLFVYPCFGVLALLYNKEGRVDFLKRTGVILTLALGAYLLICSWIAGSFGDYLKTCGSYIQLQNTIDYAVRFQKGPWFRYVVDFLLVSPLVCLLAVAGIAACLTGMRDQEGKKMIALYFLVSYAVFSLLPLLNLRNVLFLDVFLRGLAVLGLVSVTQGIRQQKYRFACLAAVFLLVMATDVQHYFRLFVASRIFDPVTVKLMQGNGLFIP